MNEKKIINELKAAGIETKDNSLTENAKSLVSELETQQVYTLAQHSSHCSHGSHSSHSSHSSGGARTISIDDDGLDELAVSVIGLKVLQKGRRLDLVDIDHARKRGGLRPLQHLRLLDGLTSLVVAVAERKEPIFLQHPV